jgi:hypothetical protein
MELTDRDVIKILLALQILQMPAWALVVLNAFS